MKEVFEVASIKKGIELNGVDFLMKNPDWFVTVADVYNKTVSGEYVLNKGEPDEVLYRDLFLQIDARQEQNKPAFGFYILQFMIGLYEKDMDLSSIEVGFVPGADREGEGNNRKLEYIVPPFKATFVGGPGDGSDGSVSWPDDWLEAPNIRCKAFAGIHSLPLEVGTCDVCTLWRHLLESRGWARWPYNSKYIYMLAWSATALRKLEETVIPIGEIAINKININ